MRLPILVQRLRRKQKQNKACPYRADRRSRKTNDKIPEIRKISHKWRGDPLPGGIAPPSFFAVCVSCSLHDKDSRKKDTRPSSAPHHENIRRMIRASRSFLVPIRFMLSHPAKASVILSYQPSRKNTHLERSVPVRSPPENNKPSARQPPAQDSTSSSVSSVPASEYSSCRFFAYAAFDNPTVDTSL